MSSQAALINAFIDLDLQIKALTKQRDALKVQIINIAKANLTTDAKGVVSATILGDGCEIKVTQSYSSILSKDLLGCLLSAEDIARCYAKSVEPTYTPRIKILELA